MLDVKKVTKSYDGEEVLKGIDINIEKGSVYGLVGNNGAGKTTLLKMICGIFQQDQGQILLEGEKIYETPNMKKKICFLADTHCFFGVQKLKQLAKFYSLMYENFDMAYFEKIIKVLELDEQKAITSFSKGMKKQAMFAIVMSIKSDVLIMDELVDGIDPVKRRLLWSVLMREVADREMTVILSSHNIKEIESICSHIGIINKGVLVYNDLIDKIREDHHMTLEDFVVEKMGGESDEAKEFLYQ